MDTFYNEKSVILAVNASLRWLNKNVGVYLVQVSLLRIGPTGWRIVQCANITPTPEEKDQYSYSWCNTSSKPIHFYQYTIILH